MFVLQTAVCALCRYLHIHTSGFERLALIDTQNRRVNDLFNANINFFYDIVGRMVSMYLLAM